MSFHSPNPAQENMDREGESLLDFFSFVLIESDRPGWTSSRIGCHGLALFMRSLDFILSLDRTGPRVDTQK